MATLVLKINWHFHFPQKKMDAKEAHYAICYSSRLQFHGFIIYPKFVTANVHFSMSQNHAIFVLEICSLTLEYEWKLRYSKTFWVQILLKFPQIHYQDLIKFLQKLVSIAYKFCSLFSKTFHFIQRTRFSCLVLVITCLWGRFMIKWPSTFLRISKF